jgi:exonuclease III
MAKTLGEYLHLKSNHLSRKNRKKIVIPTNPPTDTPNTPPHPKPYINKINSFDPTLHIPLPQSNLTTSKEMIKISTLNINGDFSNKVQYIRSFLAENELDILVITETHLIKNDTNKLASLFPFFATHFSCGPKRQHGVAVIIRNEINKLISKSKDLVQGRALELTVSNLSESKNLHILATYAPANNTNDRQTAFWNGILDYCKALPQNTDLMIIGDLNVNLNKIDLSQLNSSSGNADPFLKLLNNYVTDAWRLHHTSSNEYTFFRDSSTSRIDSALISGEMSTLISNTHIDKILPHLSPDHRPFTLTLKLKSSGNLLISRSVRTVINTKAINNKTADKFIDAMSTHSFKDAPVEPLYNSLIQHITNAATATFGTRTLGTFPESSTPTHVKQLTNIVKLLTKAKLALKAWDNIPPKNILKIETLPYNWRININTKEQVKITISKKLKTAKKKLRYTLNKINKKRINKAIKNFQARHINDPSKFFRTLSDKRKPAETIAAVETPEGTSFDPKVVNSEVEHFYNELYKDKGLPTDYQDKPWFHTPAILSKRQKLAKYSLKLMSPITHKEIHLAISQCKKNKAAGPDLIPYEVLKAGGQTIYSKLAFIYNRILSTAEVPQAWRQCNIFPIFKRGSQLQVKNYRPIALLDCTYKIFANILANRLKEIIYETRLINNSQNGFVKGKTIHQKIFNLISIIKHAKINDRDLWIAYLDITKAYDTVSHSALAITLEKSGFPTPFVTLVNNLYKNNTARIITSHGLTNHVHILRGVKQGCPLSPILFTIFLNPLLDWLNDTDDGYIIEQVSYNTNAFADDLNLLSGDKSKMQNMLNKIDSFLNENGMSLSVDQDKSKSAIQNIRDTPADFYIHLNGQKTKIPQLGAKENYKYLGVQINMELNWEPMLEQLKGRITGIFEKCRRRCFTTPQLVTIFNKVVMPAIEYRMNVIQFPTNWRTWLKNYMSRVIHSKLRIYGHNHYSYLTTPTKQGGWGLLDIDTKQNEAIIKTFMSQILNGNDTESHSLGTYLLYNNPDSEVLKALRETKSKIYVKSLLNTNIDSSTLLPKSLPPSLKNSILNRSTVKNLRSLNSSSAISNDTAEVFTDASNHKGKTGYAMWSYNKSLRWKDRLPSNLPNNNFTGELLAIAQAAISTRNFKNAIIYSDSLSAIHLLEKHRTEPPSCKLPFATVLNLWHKIVKDKEQQDGTITLKHIYSHLHKRSPKIRKLMKSTYGKELPRLTKGNNSVDNYAKQATQLEPYLFPTIAFTPSNFVLTIDNQVIDSNFKQELKQWREKTTIRNIKAHNPTHDIDDYNPTLISPFLKGHSGEQAKASEFFYKVRTNKLSTRTRMKQHRDLYTECYNHSKDKDQFKSKYKINTCPSGCKTAEDTLHFLTCPLLVRYEKRLKKQVLKTINRKLYEENPHHPKVTLFPIFYSKNLTTKLSTDTPKHQTKVANWNPIHTLNGLPPPNLPKALVECGLSKASSYPVARQIISTIANNLRQRWTKRCQTLYSSPKPQTPAAAIDSATKHLILSNNFIYSNPLSISIP